MFYWFEREREVWREGGREGERNTDVREKLRLVASLGCLPYTSWPGDWTHNVGMCLDWELNLQTFGVCNSAPTYWAPWPGQDWIFSCTLRICLWRRRWHLFLKECACFHPVEMLPQWFLVWDNVTSRASGQKIQELPFALYCLPSNFSVWTLICKLSKILLNSCGIKQ